MNIYFCYDPIFYTGLYVIASSRGKAKAIFANEIDEDYINVRSEIYRRGVNEGEGIIDPDDTKTLGKYNLEYAEVDY